MSTGADAAGLPALTRWAYQGLGLLALACAIAGALLPLLPTTVFLIIAAACFGRASPRWQARLLAHPRFGPLLRDWQREGAIGRRGKALACAGMGLGLLLFWWRARPGPGLGSAVTALLLLSALYVLSRPRPRAELRSEAPAHRPGAGLRPWGLALSLGLHLLLPLAWLLRPDAAPATQAPAPTPRVSVISLLSPAAAPQPPEQRRAAPQPAREARPRPSRLPSSEQLPAPQSPTRPAPEEPPVRPQPISAAAPANEPPALAAAPPSPALPPAEQTQLAGPSDSWQGRVLAQLALHRRYPAGARARREQGVSHVRLRLGRAGQLLALQLERSSGHAELDRAALATVRAAVPLPAIPPELPEELELLLPVEFFLGRG